MPCDTKLRQGVSPVQRSAQIGRALAALEAALKNRTARVVVDRRTGAIAFEGWKAEERDDVTDICAVRRLMSKGSWELRQAIGRAEALAGRKVSEQAISAGVHSHDGGKSWGSH